MRKKASIIILSLFISTLICAQQKINVKFMFDGIEREFIVAKPTGATPNGGYPVVFAFHGTGGDGEGFFTRSGWKEKAEQDKFIAVFPSALTYCVEEKVGVQERTAKWMNGGTMNVICPNVAQTYRDDVRFTRKVLDTLKKTLSINLKKVYAAGFSNGAAMTAKLATEASDIFAAIVCSSSVLNALDTVIPPHKRPIWFVIGTQDDKFIRAPYKEIPYGGDSSLQYFNAPLTRFLNAAGLTNTYTKVVTNKHTTYTYTTPKAGMPNNIFKYTIIKDMEHIYPNGNNYPIESANIFWDFFNQYTLNTVSPTKEVVLNGDLVNAFPNPSNTSITLDLSSFNQAKNKDISVFNAVGQQVFNIKNTASETVVLQKEDVVKGMFFVKIKIDNQLVMKKIIFQ